MNEILLAFPIAKCAEYTKIMELHETMFLKNDSKSAAEGSVEDSDPKLTINERGVGYLVDVIGDQTVDNRSLVSEGVHLCPDR